MRIKVKVKTGKREVKIIKNEFADYEVWVKSKPIKGTANNELIKVLANYFNTTKNNLWIVKGSTSSNKTIELRE